MRALTAAAVAGLLMLGLAGSAAAAPTPIAVVRKVMATAPGKMPQSIRCVSPQELRQEIRRANGRVPANPLGVAFRRSGRILLDWKRVCLPIHRYETGHPVDSVNLVWALSAVFHEKAHLNGIRAEWKATCWAIRPTLKQLRRWGIKADDLEKVQHYLTHTLDGYRPEEYKLYGRCRV